MPTFFKVQLTRYFYCAKNCIGILHTLVKLGKSWDKVVFTYLLVQFNEFRTLGKDSVWSLCMKGVLKQIDHSHVEKQQFPASWVPIFLSAVSPSIQAHRPPPLMCEMLTCRLDQRLPLRTDVDSAGTQEVKVLRLIFTGDCHWSK